MSVTYLIRPYTKSSVDTAAWNTWLSSCN